MQERKLAVLKRIVEQTGSDAVLVYSPAWRKENFRFLTGSNFYGSFALVLYLAQEDKIYIFHTSVYDAPRFANAMEGIAGILPANDRGAALTKLLREKHIKLLSISSGGLLPARVEDAVRIAGAKTCSAEGFIERERYCKTPQEVECLRKAVELADRAFPTFVDAICRGKNEFEVAAEVEYALKKMGAEDNFMLISTGQKEVFGMTPPQNRTAKPGDLVLTELTPQLNGWWCQICRTVVKGEPSETQKRIFSIFMEAEQAGLDMLRPGVNINDVAKAENDVFRKYGYGDYITSQYTRVRGHGHGMHLDEAPTVNEGVDFVVEEGMVIVVHPNTYNPETGYMVMGDPVVVTADGYRMLSTTERKLFVAK